MAMTVEARLVDGGLLTYDTTPKLWRRLLELEAKGLAGKALIHELLPDDWGPPPVSVTISGRSDDGKKVSRYIPYD